MKGGEDRKDGGTKGWRREREGREGGREGGGGKERKGEGGKDDWKDAGRKEWRGGRKGGRKEWRGGREGRRVGKEWEKEGGITVSGDIHST